MKKQGKKVVVRFAPSPTGLFHIGSARTALFNFLFSKKNNGVFVFRIEDTDKERYKIEYEKDIIESLEWLGIKWDKGPFRQSERKDVYKKYLEKLLKENKAYRCFCSQEDLESVRQEQMSRGVAPKYNGKCRNISESESQKRANSKEKFVIRFRTPEKKVKFIDLIRGEIEFDGSLIGDFAIAKTMESPLYNFSVVIDDAEMGITHAIRGEDLLPNTPKQIFLADALGFDNPEFAHLPLILGPDKRKLSKRHGATSVNEYKKEGYLKEAIINFIAFLGWNPGTDKEIYSLEELINDFSLEKIQKGGAVFNIKKLDYINGLYIRKKTIDELAELCIPYLKEKGMIGDFEYVKKAVSLYHERLKKLSEITDLADFFFQDKIKYDRGLLKWKDATSRETARIIDKLINILSDIKEEDWKKENLEEILLKESEEISLEIKNKKDRGFALWPLRVALTGKEFSAGPFEIAEILGREKTLNRLKQAKE